MASSSSSSGSCWKHDVFLNFRGEDTRKIFVSHLNKALEQKTINTFIDSEELRKGDDISEILNAIQNSRLSVVVLSENYASSTWCLKELVTILDCMDTKNQIVVPIFYQVNPSHVRKLKRSFSDAFIKHQDDPNSDKEEVKSWQLALTRTSNLSGWDSRDYRDDAKLIEEIVDDIFNKLIHISSSKATGLVGIDSHIDEMALLLFPDQVENVRIVGIWGMGGLGKTTIARAVYDQIACQFEYCCFLENVKEGFLKYGAIHMQEELLSRILKEKRPSVGSLDRGLNMIMRRLSRKKVVLVLDDVDDLAQIETLLGKQHSFGGGSRIIITTRDAQLLGGVDAIYRPKFFGYDEALKLFMQYAFRTNQYTEDYYDLSNHAVEYAQGLPLALKVLGAFLDNKSVREWKDVFEKIKKSPHKGVQDVLKTSFDGLDHSEKDIFLDIACFFKGMNKDYATKILDSCGFFPISGLRVLVDRSLVTISNHNKLDMHDLLQETGWEIVRQESIKDPGRRSRLWSYKDIADMLTQNTATEAVESICIDLPNSKEVYLNAEAFVRMTKLRLLKVRYNRNIDSDEEALSCEDLCHPDDCKQQLTGDLKFLSHELRCLLWYGCPLKSLPSNFQPKNLFHLDMPYSNIHKLWEGTKSLKNLEFINLSHSRYLEKIPDLSEAKNLEMLILEGCVSLYEVHPSISALENLVFLSLKGCKELKILPSSIGMKSLETLILSGCSNLEKFPQISEVMKEISELYLDETAIKELPSSIENLKGLVTLNLKDCRDLLSLPSSICQLKSLRYVTLSGCSKFEVLPESICTLTNLKVLALSGCLKLHHLPENLGNLESLVKLEVRGSGIQQILFSILRLKKLKSLSGHRCKEMKEPFPSWSSSIRENCSYSSLLHLDLSDCNMLELSDGISHLSSLKMLELQRNNMESLPAAMNRLHHLTVLKLEACKRLKSIPELSSSIHFIDAHNCTSLETVLTPKPPYTNLFFTFSNCLQLVQNNPFRDVVETHYHYQGNYMRPLSFLMSLPGSEIPDWFNHQCIGSSVTVQLPKNLFDDKFLGFSICGITDVKGGHHASKLSAQCFCTFRGNHSKYSFSFYLVDWGFTTDRFLKSDHMFLRHVPWSEYHQGEPVNQRYYTEAEFKIVVKNAVNVHDFTAAAVAAVQQPCIKRSGVHFVCSSHDLWRDPANPKRSFKGYSYNEAEPSEITYDVEKYLKRLEHIGGTTENSGEYASDDAQGELFSSEIVDDAELSSSEIVDGPEQC